MVLGCFEIHFHTCDTMTKIMTHDGYVDMRAKPADCRAERMFRWPEMGHSHDKDRVKMHSIPVSPLWDVRSGWGRTPRLRWSTIRPQCLPVQPSLKQTLYWINAGPRARVGRGKLNRGEKGVSRLFQVKVEFGASVFVSNWVFSGLTDILPSLRDRAEVSDSSTGGRWAHDSNCTLTAAVGPNILIFP